MAPGGSTPARRALFFVAVVLFAFWRPLFAGGTLAPDDQIWSTAPYASEAPAGLTIEVAPPDASAVHSMWSAWADDLQHGRISQLGDGRTGAPTLADGLPFTSLLYLVVPSWYAPGLVAAAAMLLALFGAAGLLDQRGVSREAALVGGLVFGCSGVMFAWVGWPHATAFALVPWVVRAALGTIDAPGRRGIWRLAAWTTALLWCGVFAISAYTVLAVGAALAVQPGRRAAGRVLLGVATGASLAAPHLIASWVRWDWADTAATEALGDPSAAFATVITVGLGSFWGNDALGFPWFGPATFQHSVGFVGVVAVLMAGLGLAAGRATRPVLPMLWAGLGLGIAYVGGPFRVVSDLIAGPGAEMAHARILLVLAIAVLAAHGVDTLASRAWPRPTTGALAATAIAVAGGAWCVSEWVGSASDAGAIRAAIAHSMTSVLAGLILLGVLAGLRQRALAPAGAAGCVAALAAFELLSFGMALPTVTDRHERLRSTEAHDVLLELVGETGLVVGEERVLAPAASARFGPADFRQPRLRSVGELAAILAADPLATRIGGAPELPIFTAIDPEADVWDERGVDAFVQAPGRTPIGPVVRPLGEAAGRIDPAGAVLTVPVELVGGIRGVLLDLDAPAGTPVEVDLAHGGRLLFGDVSVGGGSPVVVPIPGDGLGDGVASITVRVVAPPDTATIGVDATGQPVVGLIGGGDESELVIVDGLLITVRPTPAAVAASGGRVTVGPVDDRWLPFVVNTTEPTTVRTDIVARPGWTATIDGVSVPVSGDHVLSIDVPAGEHEVEFSYRPPGLFSGLAVMLAVTGAWLVAAVGRGRRRSPDGVVAAGSVTSRD